MLAMDTVRRRTAPLRSMVDNIKRSSPRSSSKESKESKLAVRSRTLSSHLTSKVKTSSASAVSAPASTSLALSARSSFIEFDKPIAYCHSETSRSSTPMTDMSSMCPSTGSSFATSVQPDGYPEDERDSCASRSVKESDFEAGDMGYHLDEEDMAAARGALNYHVLRDSQLRYSMSALSNGASGYDESDYEDNVVMEEDDDDWSGTESLDEAVIAAVDGDLSLAAFLIPLLHRDLRNAVRNKVESWQTLDVQTPSSVTGTTVTRGGPASGATSGSSVVASGSRGSHSSRAQDQSSNQSRKRRRRPSEEEHGDEERRGNGGKSSRWGTVDEPMTMFLACPFHKLNPSKYGIQHSVIPESRKNGYRACAGPGFKTVQRLKEHLRRKHTLVQCERCYLVFQGQDKAQCINDLTEHLRLEVPCEKGEPMLKEGISEAQWAALDKQNRKKNQEKHKVEKWYEIWRVLFPEVTEPETPWYDEATPYRAPSPTRENEAFADLFLHILNHKVQQGDMSFPGCNTEEVQQRLRNLVQQTFRTFVNLHGPLSRTTETSSSLTGTNNHYTSLVGGSSTQLSRPTNSMSFPATTTSHTSASLFMPMPGPYAMAGGGGGVAGGPYAAPMGQRANGLQYMPMTLAAMGGVSGPIGPLGAGGTAAAAGPAGPAGGAGGGGGNVGAAMPGGFAGRGQDEMGMFYPPLTVAQWQTAGMQFGSAYPSDYYGQAGYGQTNSEYEHK